MFPLEHNPFLCDKCSSGKRCLFGSVAEAEEKIIRERRHLAAFLGDCRVPSCDVCHPKDR